MTDFDEDELDDDEIIRAKWVMDGASTLPEAAAQLREYADQLDRLHGEGFRLRGKIDDDYGYICKPEN